ncbi:MAG: adenylyltransferase/cytidyltransferase family protein [Candidatus Neomarinimicrobiota bacterium]
MAGNIRDWEDCAQWVRTQQQAGRQVIFTNGCFDLLHAGHIYLLRAARKLGDCLVIGLNSDESITRLKGSGRPVTPVADRAAILGALEMVDTVVIFPRESAEPEGVDPELHDTPQALLQLLQPDVLVKGGDYAPDQVVGREFAGRVEMIPLLPGRSTTGLLTRLGRE